MERFVIIVNGWKLLTIITKRSILDVAAVLDLPRTNVFNNVQQFLLDNPQKSTLLLTTKYQ